MLYGKIRVDSDYMKKFWEYRCRKCWVQIQYCTCRPIPCPFCEKEEFWVQDWNVHLNEKHEGIMRKFEWSDP